MRGKLRPVATKSFVLRCERFDPSIGHGEVLFGAAQQFRLLATGSLTGIQSSELFGVLCLELSDFGVSAQQGRG